MYRATTKAHHPSIDLVPNQDFRVYATASFERKKALLHGCFRHGNLETVMKRRKEAKVPLGKASESVIPARRRFRRLSLGMHPDQFFFSTAKSEPKSLESTQGFFFFRVAIHPSI
jgi:hypothetical protein